MERKIRGDQIYCHSEEVFINLAEPHARVEQRLPKRFINRNEWPESIFRCIHMVLYALCCSSSVLDCPALCWCCYLPCRHGIGLGSFNSYQLKPGQSQKEEAAVSVDHSWAVAWRVEKITRVTLGVGRGNCKWDRFDWREHKRKNNSIK